MALSNWFVRFSRFGTTHLVRAQEGANACGAACAMMAACRMDKVRTVAEAMHSETKTYDKVNAVTSYPAATGENFVGSNAGIAATEMAELMNSLGMGCGR